jgi:hypothetical protein
MDAEMEEERMEELEESGSSEQVTMVRLRDSDWQAPLR